MTDQGRVLFFKGFEEVSLAFEVKYRQPAVLPVGDRQRRLAAARTIAG
jgi:hypothetical protein